MNSIVEMEVHQTLLKQRGQRTLGGSIRGEKRKCKLPEACSFAELAVLYIESNSFVTSWLTIQVNIFMAITSIN